MALTVVTWNLKGSAGPDVAAVAAHLREVGADVVALQEVQRRHARVLAGLLGARSWRWGFKHWPFRTWPEGMAVIGVTATAEVRTHALSFRWRPWTWRRRIFQDADVTPGDGSPVVLLVNLHLSTRREEERRAGEVAAVLRVVGGAARPTVVVGDLNDRPGAPLFAQLAAAGLRDAWDDAHPGATEADSATNWPGWKRGTTKAPARRLDFVVVSGDVEVATVDVPRPGGPGFAAFPALSDHLPVTATLAVREPPSA